METALSNFQEKVDAIILDLEGQDEWFYHESAMRTIYWWMGRLKTIAEASTDFRTGAERSQFIDAIAAGYPKMSRQRIYEGLVVYKKFSKASDSLKESCERIFQEVGGWSKALPAKKQEEQKVECNHKCPVCCNHEAFYRWRVSHIRAARRNTRRR